MKKKNIHVKEYTRKRHGRAKFGGKVRAHDKSGRYSRTRTDAYGVHHHTCDICGKEYPDYELQTYKGKNVCTPCIDNLAVHGLSSKMVDKLKSGRAKASKRIMMVKTQEYLNRLASEFEVDPALVRDDGEDTFQVYTDGRMYDILYNPDERAAVIYDANTELGVDSKKVDPMELAYREQNRFGEFLRRNGWDFDLKGGGILVIYPE